MEHEKIIKLPMYANYRLWFIITNNMEQTKARLKKRYKLNHTTEFSEAFCAHFNSGGTLMVLPYNAPPDTIAHESLHAVDALFDFIGAKNVDNEIMAYTLGYVVEQATKQQKKYKEKYGA